MPRRLLWAFCVFFVITAFSASSLAQVATTTTVASAGASTLGQQATFSAQMTATTAPVTPAAATGKITFLDGSTVIGKSSIVSYAAWAATTAYTNQIITPTAVSNTGGFEFQATTAGTSGGSEPDWSTAQTIGATVSDGTVTWTNIGYAYTAQFSTSLLAVGSHSITAVYSGDSNFATSTSSAATHTVNTRGTSVALGLTPTSVTVRGTSTTNVSVSDSVNGVSAGMFATLSPNCTNPAGSGMCTPRSSAVILYVADKNVLGIAGGIDATGGTVLSSIESYDPSTGNFTKESIALGTARACATGTGLMDGSILVVGGTSTASGGACTSTGALSSAEINTPGSNSFVATTGGLTSALYGHTATLFAGGNVLIAGGNDGTGTAQTATYIYNSGAQTFGAGPASLLQARYGATAVLLTAGPNAGKVLIAGGDAGGDAEIFDPTGGSAGAMTGSLNKKRVGATATVLPDGLVLIAGGLVSGVADNTVEIYDPTVGTFTLVGGADWAVSASYAYGTVITPSSNTANAGGYSYMVTTAGTSGATEPASFTQTVGNTTTDNGVTWTNIGVRTMSSTRANALAFAYSDPGSSTAKVFFAGGLDKTATTLGTAESYTPSYDPVGATTLASDQTPTTTDTVSGCPTLFLSGAGISTCVGSVVANHWNGTTPNTNATHNETAGYAGTGAHSGNSSTAQSLAVSQQQITLTANTATMTYSGSLACASPTAGSCTPTLSTGSFLGDTVTDGENFSTRNAGSGLTLTPTFSAVDPADSVNSTSDFFVTNVTVNTGVISQLALTVKAVADTKTYDGTTNPSSVSVVPALSSALGTGTSALAPPDTASFTQSFSTRNAGTGIALVINGTTVNDGNSGNNYTYTFDTTTNTGTINKLALTVQAVADTKTYDGTTNPSGVSVIPALSSALGTGTSALASPDTASFTQNFSTINAGTGILLVINGTTVNDGNSGNNYAYTFDTTTNTGTILQRPITLTTDAQTKVYGTPDPALTYQLTGGTLATGDAFSGVLNRVTGEAVGTPGPTYTINQNTVGVTRSATDVTPNYAVTYVPAVLTITARPITVSVPAESKIYGEPDPSLAVSSQNITIGGMGLATTNTQSGSADTVATVFSGQALSRTTGQNVGSYNLVQNTATGNANYAITFTQGTFTINPRPVNIAVNAGQNKFYGEPEPTLTYTVQPGAALTAVDASAPGLAAANTASGAADTEATVFTGALDRTSNMAAGTYSISVGTLAANANYAATFNSGTSFTVNPRPVDVVVNGSQSKIYGQPEPTLTFSLMPDAALLAVDSSATGYATSNTADGTADNQAKIFVGVLDRGAAQAANQAAGTYTINPGTLAANANYNVTVYTPATFTVNTASTTAGRLVSAVVVGASGTYKYNVSLGYDSTTNGGACIPTLPGINCVPDGQVTIQDATQGKTFTGTLSGGTITLDPASQSAFAQLTPGVHSITITYAPGSNYNANNTTQTFTLNVIAPVTQAIPATTASVAVASNQTVSTPGTSAGLTTVILSSDGTKVTGGFSAPNQIGCIVLFAGTRTVPPSCSVTVAGTEVTITVNTSSVHLTSIHPNSAPLGRPFNPFAFGLVLPAVVLAGLGTQERRMKRGKAASWLILLVVFVMILAAVGCGGGSFNNTSATPVLNTSGTTSPGAYTAAVYFTPAGCSSVACAQSAASVDFQVTQ